MNPKKELLWGLWVKILLPSEPSILKQALPPLLAGDVRVGFRVQSLGLRVGPFLHIQSGFKRIKGHLCSTH